MKKQITLLFIMLLTFNWKVSAQVSDNFDSYTVGEDPTGWTKYQSSDVDPGFIITDTRANSAPNSLYHNDDDTGELSASWIVAPVYTATGNDQVSFYYQQNFTATFYQYSGVWYSTTGTNPIENPDEWTELAEFNNEDQPYSEDEWTNFFHVFTEEAGTNIYIAFKYEGNYNHEFYIDDFIIDVTPNCVIPSNLSIDSITTSSADVSWTDNNSGNIAYLIEWHQVESEDEWNSFTTDAGATGYQIPGLTAKTHYEWRVTAVCNEEEITEAVYGPEIYTWYCVSQPSSNDNNGISNVQLGTTDYAIEDVTYADFTAETPVDFAQGEVANVQITFETGYSYYTNIWIDFNDNLIFEEDELVYQGESTSDNPSVLDASFEMPADVPLGNHYMRIGTAYSGQATPNPCYNGTFGVTLDFSVNIVEGSQAIQTLAQYQFNLYPNPVQNNLNLSANSNIKSISIYNMTGQEVLHSTPAQTQLTIDTPNLNKGSYILKVNINDTFGYYRFIKR